MSLGPGATDVPDLVPARRVNEFTYCALLDPVRLRRVHATMKAYGFALQYSVFICDLAFVEKINLCSDLGGIIHVDHDSVALVQLGDPSRRGESCFDFMGLHPVLPRSGPTIV